jgi:2-polyprenyl-3-methyl-5-hydroxy-6-metoxy-1,4-benzoquinol methylase
LARDQRWFRTADTLAADIFSMNPKTEAPLNLAGLTHQGTVQVSRQDAVTWGYRLFLDRDPVISEMVGDKVLKLKDTKELRESFLGCSEFRSLNPVQLRTPMSGHEPRLLIDLELSDEDLQSLLRHIQETWQQLGKTEPYWSVLSNKKYLSSNMQDPATREAFYYSGKPEMERVIKTLKRNDIELSNLKSCVEYGCGLGRVTPWLAQHLQHVHGCDISAEHLKIAGEHLKDCGIHNVDLLQIKSVTDIENLPRVDFIYSMIVLQHNPPPIIRYIIRNFMRALNPGGIALFQVPTYRPGYEFSLKKYLSKQARKNEIEMHVLPQMTIFEILHQEGCRLIEIREDGWVGFAAGGLSNTFLVQKT